MLGSITPAEYKETVLKKMFLFSYFNIILKINIIPPHLSPISSERLIQHGMTWKEDKG